MDDRIEQVKKILRRDRDARTVQGWVDKIEADALEICQLFPQPLDDKGKTCPFCGDAGFDLIGLKDHFSNYCTVYQDTEVLR